MKFDVSGLDQIHWIKSLDQMFIWSKSFDPIQTGSRWYAKLTGNVFEETHYQKKDIFDKYEGTNHAIGAIPKGLSDYQKGL